MDAIRCKLWAKGSQTLDRRRLDTSEWSVLIRPMRSEINLNIVFRRAETRKGQDSKTVLAFPFYVRGASHVLSRASHVL